ncbi:MAG TPA: hypothetical protein VHN77_07390 [Phycisphaerales bacterium]|nr:hypothetical protein [Phycisphaerales bacterium]
MRGTVWNQQFAVITSESTRRVGLWDGVTFQPLGQFEGTPNDIAAVGGDLCLTTYAQAPLNFLKHVYRWAPDSGWVFEGSWATPNHALNLKVVGSNVHALGDGFFATRVNGAWQTRFIPPSLWGSSNRPTINDIAEAPDGLYAVGSQTIWKFDGAQWSLPAQPALRSGYYFAGAYFQNSLVIGGDFVAVNSQGQVLMDCMMNSGSGWQPLPQEVSSPMNWLNAGRMSAAGDGLYVSPCGPDSGSTSIRACGPCPGFMLDDQLTTIVRRSGDTWEVPAPSEPCRMLLPETLDGAPLSVSCGPSAAACDYPRIDRLANGDWVPVAFGAYRDIAVFNGNIYDVDQPPNGVGTLVRQWNGAAWDVVASSTDTVFGIFARPSLQLHVTSDGFFISDVSETQPVARIAVGPLVPAGSNQPSGTNVVVLVVDDRLVMALSPSIEPESTAVFDLGPDGWVQRGRSISGMLPLSMTVHDGDLYVGGQITSWGGERNLLLRWSSGGWDQLTMGAGTNVVALASQGGDLYALGNFSEWDLTNTWGVVRIVERDCCDTVDFNSDSMYPDTFDIEEFLTAFGGGVCSTGHCGDLDFNNDGVSPDSADIAALLSAFSGGPCP